MTEIKIDTNKHSEYVMIFGKHKGKMLKNIDKSYLRYVVDQHYYCTDEIKKYVDSLSYIEYIFRFGKHRGKTLQEVYEIDKNYLNYIRHQEWFKDKDIVKEYTEKIKNI